MTYAWGVLSLPIEERDVHALLVRLAECAGVTDVAVDDVAAALDAVKWVQYTPEYLAMVMVGVAHM